MKKLTEIRGEVVLEDSYCRISSKYTAEWDGEDWWDISLGLPKIYIISSTGFVTQELNPHWWQKDRSLEILESRLEVEARKDLAIQLSKYEEDAALGGADVDNYW